VLPVFTRTRQLPGTKDEPAPTTNDEPPAPTNDEPAAADGEDAPQGPLAPGDESRTGGAGGNDSPAEGEAEAEHERVPDDQLTDKGLPKRTPKLTEPTSVPRPRSGNVDADALRRRLGGFRRGAEAGYRDVEVEIAEHTGQTKAPAEAPAREPAPSEAATGGTVEEASS
jgi:hypothetical protein